MKPRTKWIIAGLASSLLMAVSAPSFATTSGKAEHGGVVMTRTHGTYGACAIQP